MNINTNLGVNNTRGVSLNLMTVNKSVLAQHDTPSKKEGNNIQLSTTLAGRSMNRVDSLMKQRQVLLERKDEMATLARESGKDKKTIEEEMKVFNEQLKNLDEQIIKTSAEEMEKNNKKDSPSKLDLDKKTTENIFTIITAANSLKEAEEVVSIKNKIDREIGTLSGQIKTDGSKVSSRKMEELGELQSRSTDLMGKIGKIQGNINSELGEIADETIEEVKGNYKVNNKSIEEKEEKKEQENILYKSIDYIV